MSARDEELYEDAVLEDAAARRNRVCPYCLGRGCPECWDDEEDDEVTPAGTHRDTDTAAHCGARHEGLSNPGGHQFERRTT